MKSIRVIVSDYGKITALRLEGILTYFHNHPSYLCEIVDSETSPTTAKPDGTILLNCETSPQNPSHVRIKNHCEQSASCKIRENQKAVGEQVAKSLLSLGCRKGIFLCYEKTSSSLWQGFAKTMRQRGGSSIQIHPSDKPFIKSSEKHETGVFLTCDLLTFKFPHLINLAKTDGSQRSPIIARGNHPSLTKTLNITSTQEASRRIGFLAAAALSQILSGKQITELLEVSPLPIISRLSTYRFANYQIKSVGIALRYIRHNLANDISVNDVAKAAGTSRSVIQRQFKQDLRITILNAIQWHRVEQVKKLLISTDFTMEEISEGSGFSSAAQMCNTFKKWTGSTPSIYRNQFGH